MKTKIFHKIKYDIKVDIMSLLCKGEVAWFLLFDQLSNYNDDGYVLMDNFFIFATS